MESIELEPLQARAKWLEVFNHYDLNHDGKINFREFKKLIKSNDYKRDIPKNVVKEIFDNADTDGNRTLDFDEFLRMVHHEHNEDLFVHVKDRFKQIGDTYMKLLLPQKPDPSDRDCFNLLDKCKWPPAIAMTVLSIVIAVLYAVDAFAHNTTNAQGPVANKLIYDPHRRKEAWRYVTYMFVHDGNEHLLMNIILQLLLGIPLEIKHKGPRVLVVYVVGVLAGSLGCSIIDKNYKVAGASGGVYCLLTAHLASIILNWNQMTWPCMQLGIFCILIGTDIGSAVYVRYILQSGETISHAAHFFGALAGLLFGIAALRNVVLETGEKKLKMAAMVIFLLLIVTAIVWNAVWTDYFPIQNV